MFKLYKF